MSSLEREEKNSEPSQVEAPPESDSAGPSKDPQTPAKTLAPSEPEEPLTEGDIPAKEVEEAKKEEPKEDDSDLEPVKPDQGFRGGVNHPVSGKPKPRPQPHG